MRIFVVPIYTSMVLSHSSMHQIILILVAFKMPVYSLFCCGAALFLLLWASHLSPAVGSRAIVKVGAVVLC